MLYRFALLFLTSLLATYTTVHATTASERKLEIRTIPQQDLAAYIGESGMHVSGKPTQGWEVRQRNGVFAFIMSEQNIPEMGSSNLFAACGIHDHGGILDIFRMKDFTSAVYTPSFDYDASGPADADGDGLAEYYIVYFADSDGLDAKPLKVLVYWNHKKYRVTAFYPAGNAEDRYNVQYDKGWNELPNAVAQHARAILAKLKNRYRDR